jgi:hypothetical protein
MGKCLGGACQNHAITCRGGNNIRGYRKTVPQYDPEDDIIAAIDNGINAEEIVGMFFPITIA